MKHEKNRGAKKRRETGFSQIFRAATHPAQLTERLEEATGKGIL